MKITKIFTILLLLYFASFTHQQIIDILLGPILNLLNSILGGLLNIDDKRKLAEILLKIEREYSVKLSPEEIKEKVDHFLQLKTEIDGKWGFEMTVYFFLPKELQIKLGGGNGWLSPGEDPNGEFHIGEVTGTPKIGPPLEGGPINGEQEEPDEESPLEEEPVETNKTYNEEHPRDKRASCTYKNVFSSRVKWSECAPIINRITDQGQCGSCWAVSTSGAFTDRLCIERAKKGWKTPNDASYIYSALDALSCSGGGNCVSGRPATVWDWMYRWGICTGTSYNTYEGCKPYPFSSGGRTYTPDCYESCDSNWNTRYFDDKRKVKSWRYVSGNSININDIMRELETNGPVIGIFRIYTDLFGFIGDGVYIKSRSAQERENHVVEIIGYGTQVCNGYETDYWLIKNSWNPSRFGDNGFFKMRRGWNECYIESNQFSYGIPYV
ncbi:hypothetical protein ACQ4LE_003589 [Meloidogyne hapla]|uniref:Pept_C1 domain-containing protein n=1 Tax=Meloidogyne hapla TaxID=6305 RepID=A0A1I8AZK8_MELHA